MVRPTRRERLPVDSASRLSKISFFTPPPSPIAEAPVLRAEEADQLTSAAWAACLEEKDRLVQVEHVGHLE